LLTIICRIHVALAPAPWILRPET